MRVRARVCVRACVRTYVRVQVRVPKQGTARAPGPAGRTRTERVRRGAGSGGGDGGMEREVGRECSGANLWTQCGARSSMREFSAANAFLISFDLTSALPRLVRVCCFLSCWEQCEGQTVYLSKRSFRYLASPEASQPLQQFLDLLQQRHHALNNAVVESDGPRDELSSPKERRSRRIRKGSSCSRILSFDRKCAS
jgi:hypothetical protein